MSLLWSRGDQSASSWIIFCSLDALTGHTVSNVTNDEAMLIVRSHLLHCRAQNYPQVYLRQIRDDKLLSSLPSLSLEKRRSAGRCTTLLFEISAVPAIGWGNRHRAALSLLQCMREVCMSRRPVRATQIVRPCQHTLSSKHVVHDARVTDSFGKFDTVSLGLTFNRSFLQP